MSRGGAERERETQNPKQAPGSELSAQSPMRGSNSQTVRSWPEPKSDAQPTEPPRRPTTWHFKKLNSHFLSKKYNFWTFKITYNTIINVKIVPLSGLPGRLRQLSVWLRLRSWSRGSWVRAPHRALCWQPGACFGFCISRSLCPSPTRTLSLSLSVSWK